MIVWPEIMRYKMDEVIEALNDVRVIRTLELALRDARIRRRFRRLRNEMTVLDACEALAEEFCLSPERVKSIAYHRRREEVHG